MHSLSTPVKELLWNLMHVVSFRCRYSRHFFPAAQYTVCWVMCPCLLDAIGNSSGIRMETDVWKLMFIIFAGSSYSIKNMRSDTAKLYYVNNKSMDSNSESLEQEEAQTQSLWHQTLYWWWWLSNIWYTPPHPRAWILTLSVAELIAWSLHGMNIFKMSVSHVYNKSWTEMV